MRKYTKPTLNIEELTISNVISTSIIANLGANTEVAGDKGVDLKTSALENGINFKLKKVKAS